MQMIMRYTRDIYRYKKEKWKTKDNYKKRIQVQMDSDLMRGMKISIFLNATRRRNVWE